MCSCISQHFKQYVQQMVQLTAQLLVQELPSNQPRSVLLKDCKAQYVCKCLLWLCKTAGRDAVNRPPLAHTILILSKTAGDVIHPCFGKTLAQGGLVLTEELLVFACKQHLPGHVIEDITSNLPGLTCAAADIYKAVAKADSQPATRPIPYSYNYSTHEDTVCWQKVNALEEPAWLRKVTADILPDLLHIVISYREQPLGKLAAAMLLKHDKDRLYFFNAPAQTCSPCATRSGFTPAHACSSVQDEAGSPGISQHPVQGLQVLQTDSLLTGLVQACFESNQKAVLSLLAGLPAMRHAKAPAVLHMLQCAVRSTPVRVASAQPGDVYSSFLAWLAMHAAQSISPESLASLLEEAINAGATSVDFLLGLPATKQLSARYLLQLGSRAALGNAARSAGELIRTAATRVPDSAAMDLFKAIIINPFGYSCLSDRPWQVHAAGNFSNCFLVLSELHLTDWLSKEDVLELLQYSSDRGCFYAWAQLADLCGLGLSDSTQQLVHCLKATLQGAASLKDVKLPEPRGNLMSRLQPADLLELVHASLRGPLASIHPGLRACRQAVHCWSADDTTQLLQLAISKQDWEGFLALVALPPAGQPSAGRVAELVQQVLAAVSGGLDGGSLSQASKEACAAAVNSLMCLPGAHHVPGGDRLQQALGAVTNQEQDYLVGGQAGSF